MSQLAALHDIRGAHFHCSGPELAVNLPPTSIIDGGSNLFHDLLLYSQVFTVEKAEHLCSALHGTQTTLKCSGMDHTV